MRRRQTRAKGRRNRRTRKRGGGVPAHLVANGPLPNVLVKSSQVLQQLATPPTLNDIATSVETFGISKPNLMRFLPILVDLIESDSANLNRRRQAQSNPFSFLTPANQLFRLTIRPVEKASSVSDTDWKQIGILVDYFMLPESVLNMWVQETIWRCTHGSDPNELFDMDKPGTSHFQLFDRLLREKHDRIPQLAGARNGVPLLQWYMGMSEVWYWALNYFVAAAAAHAGHINVLVFLEENSYKWHAEITARAAEGGNLEALQWLRERGCPWRKEVCMAAAHRCDMVMLQWAIKKGCPYDKLSVSASIPVGCNEMRTYVSGLPVYYGPPEKR
jgi:hypothetical protein